MNYIYKQYDIETKKNITEKRIVTLSDLHFNTNITKTDIDDLILKINDVLPQYIFLLGDLFTLNNLDDKTFKENILYLFKLLSSIGKTYLVFGNHDYLSNPYQKNFFTSVDKLLEFYDKTNVKVISNYLVEEDDFNIIGFNKFPLTYNLELKSISSLKKEINELIFKIKDILNEDKFTIFLTHSHLDLFKLELEFLEKVDLILAGHTHNGLVPNGLEKIFKNRSIITGSKILQKNTIGHFTQNNQEVIINGGITKISDSHSQIIKKLTNNLYPSEIDIIKIKQYKR